MIQMCTQASLHHLTPKLYCLTLNHKLLPDIKVSKVVNIKKGPSRKCLGIHTHKPCVIIPNADVYTLTPKPST